MGEDVPHFGEFIRWSAARRGWKRAELARRSGCDAKTITNVIERETPEGLDDTTIAGLARAFGVRESELLRRGRKPLKSADDADDALLPPMVRESLAANVKMPLAEWLAKLAGWLVTQPTHWQKPIFDSVERFDWQDAVTPSAAAAETASSSAPAVPPGRLANPPEKKVRVKRLGGVLDHRK